MDKRIAKRIIVSLKAELILDSKSYFGVIENLSESGVYLEATTTKTGLNLIPGTKIRLNFQNPSKEKINLNCEVRHFNSIKNIFQEMINKTGLEIKDPPLQYKAFLKTLE